MFTLREAQRGRCVSGRWERARVLEEEEGGRASEEGLEGLSVSESKSFVSGLLQGAVCGVNSIKR